jgi:uncharacterized membrane protein
MPSRTERIAPPNGCRAALERHATASGIQWTHAARRGDRSLTSAGSGVARRWTVIASGLLLLALALVVIYTKPRVFLSPAALVVVAAIGLAAILLQVRFRKDLSSVTSPLWLNILGLLCAVFSLSADYLGITRRTLDLFAFAAVICFGISGSLILHALRRRQVPK